MMKVFDFFKIKKRNINRKTNLLIHFLIIIIAFILQVSIIPNLPFMNTVPNLLLIIVITYGLIYGERVGIIVGIICGLLYDLYFDENFGVYILIYSILGYFNGYLKRFFTEDSISLPMILCIINTFIFNVYIYIINFFIKGRFNFLYCLINIIFPNILITLIAIIIIYKLLFNFANKE